MNTQGAFGAFKPRVQSKYEARELEKNINISLDA